MSKKIIKAWGVLENGRLDMAEVASDHDGICYQILVDEFEVEVARNAGRTVRPIEIHIPEASDER